MPSRKVWMFNPHAGGSKIPPDLQARVTQRILAHARKMYPGKPVQIQVRFRGALCYIDGSLDPAETPFKLCRLRYFKARDHWSWAFYTYSHERYEPSMFPSGDWFGTPEEAFEIAAGCYLQ